MLTASSMVTWAMHLSHNCDELLCPIAGGATDPELDEFVTTLKTQVEIFVNRMKSNSSRGRSITNDSSVQTLFMNTMAMHSKLLKHIQDQEDKRVYYEGLQVKHKVYPLPKVTKDLSFCPKRAHIGFIFPLFCRTR